MPIYNPPASGTGAALSVTDGSTTVDPATALDFTSGATVTDGGGGIAQVAIGGSQTWQGPFDFDHTMAEEGTGGFSGLAIISLDDFVPLAENALLLRIAAVVTTSFDNMSGGFALYVGDDTNGYNSPTFSADAGDYSDASGRARQVHFTIGVNATDIPPESAYFLGYQAQLIEMADLPATIIWTPDDDTLPTAGAGKLWIEAVAP